MATYHLRLKHDKKPDGTRISAIAHAEYVNREGKYRDYDARNDILEHLSGNFIFSDKMMDVFDSEFMPLYHTDSYGSIAATKNGIELTRKPSIDTVSIALMIADRTMQHTPLKLKGSRRFQDLAVKAVVVNNLNVSFVDEKLQKQVKERKQIVDDEQKRFIANGGKILRNGVGGWIRPNNRNRGNEWERRNPTGIPGRCPILRSDDKPCISYLEGRQETVVDFTKRGFCLPTLSERGLVSDEEKQNSGMHVPSEETADLDNIERRFYQSVRWDVARAKRGLAEKTANHIVDFVIDKKGEHAAERHLEYINRTSVYEKKGGCLMTGAQLPKWANGSAKEFFAAADKYEAETHRRYMELELSLPNELSLAENKKILDEFLANHLRNHYYAWAIHEKEGVISGQRHPHVHIMFSERIIDDIERKKERCKTYYFKKGRKLDKNGNLYPESVLRKKGAPKDKKWHSVHYLHEIRADFARMQNNALKQNGFSVTVDHRSLKAQMEEAIAEGDEFMANLLKRLPEEYIGIISPLDRKSRVLREVIKNRENVREYQSILYAAEKLKKEISELELKDAVSDTLSTANDILHSTELDEARETIDAIEEYETDITKAVQEVNFWKNMLITAEDAEMQAKEEYMTEEEKRVYQAYYDIHGQMLNWQEFLENLQEPEQETEAWNSYQDVKDAVEKKLLDYRKKLDDYKKEVDLIEERFVREKLKSSIEKSAHNIMKENAISQKELERARKTLENEIEALRQIVGKNETKHENQTEYQLGEIYAILRRQFFGYQKELKKEREREKALGKKVISIQRARLIAEDKFLGGEGKKLRERTRKLEKQEMYWKNDLAKYEESLAYLESEEFRGKTLAEQKDIKTKLQETHHKLTNRKHFLDIERDNIEKTRIQINDTLSLPENQEKITFIVAGIIRKNQKDSEQHQKSVKKCEQLQQKINRTKIRMSAVKKRIANEKTNGIYKVDMLLTARIMKIDVGSISMKDVNGEDRSVLETIADAMAGDAKALPLVFRSTNGTKLEENWMLMSEWDRSEKAYKAMLREI